MGRTLASREALVEFLVRSRFLLLAIKKIQNRIYNKSEKDILVFQLSPTTKLGVGMGERGGGGGEGGVEIANSARVL